MITKHGTRRGQTAIMFTLAVIPLFGVIGLVVDVGWAFFRKEAAQTAADAAATAAALAAYHSAAGSSTSCSTPHVGCYTTEYTCPATLASPPANNIIAGCMYARDNGFVTGGRRRVTMQSGVGSAPTASGVTTSYWVVARVHESIPQLFSAVLGNPTMNITARATTGVRDASSGGCVITLDPTASGSITMTGTTTLMSGCGVFVNSNSPSAITAVGGGTIQTISPAKTEIVGNWSGSGTITPAPVTGVPHEGDPFAELEPPTVGSCNSTVPNMGSHGNKTIDPGVYCDGINLSSHQNLTLRPGLYIVKNGINLGAQTSLSGTGVTIYIQSGGVSMSGGAAVNLTAPSSGDWQGILFFQARDNATQSTLVGGTTQSMNGALYFPAAHLTYTGGSNVDATATTIIANTLSMVGNSYISASATTAFTGTTGGVVLIE
jgi:hypothetical protein